MDRGDSDLVPATYYRHCSPLLFFPCFCRFVLKSLAFVCVAVGVTDAAFGDILPWYSLPSVLFAHPALTGTRAAQADRLHTRQYIKTGPMLVALLNVKKMLKKQSL